MHACHRGSWQFPLSLAAQPFLLSALRHSLASACIMANQPTPPPSEVATASDAFRQILSCQDENILVALRDSVSLADLARLHDLVGSRVFTELVNFVGPSAAAPAAAPAQPCWCLRCLLGCSALPDADGNRTWADASDPPSEVTPFEYPVWVDPGLSPRSLYEKPWTTAQGWQFTVRLPVRPCRLVRPTWWPYSDLFCLRWEEIPRWVEVQEPVEALRHLAIKGYCSCSCEALDPSDNCQGLCLRPVHYRERTGHDGHRCLVCVRENCY